MSTTKHWRSRKNGTRRKNRSLVSNWTNCWCSGNRKHRGLVREAPAHALQQAILDLDRAYTNFFEKRAKFPKFHKKGVRDSFRESDQKCIKLEQGNNRIQLPKIGWVRYRNSREVLGEIRSVTVSQSAGQWHVSVNTLRQVEPPRHAATAVVGIDWGVAQFITPSEGPRRPVVPTQKVLAQAQDVAAAVGTQAKVFE